MFEVKDLANATGLSETQVRRRLSALDGLVNIQRGSSNKFLVDDNGLELLRRLEEYRESGLTVEKAVERIRRELEDSDGVERCESSVEVKPNGELRAVKRENKQLKERVQELKLQNEWLKDRIETIDAKLPTAKEGTGGRQDDFKELSLLGVIKKWFATET